MSDHASYTNYSEGLLVNPVTPVLSSTAPPGNFTARVACTVNCRLKIGVNPVATSQDYIIFANRPEFLYVNGNENISLLAMGVGGEASISWVIF